LNNQHNLSSIPIGQRVQLKKINANRRITHRLTELGLTPGVELTVVQDNGGPLLLSVRGSRIAIGRDMADQILVTVFEGKLHLHNQPTNLIVNQIAK
jgi:Fe2+ transport system protein FeoA